MTETCPFCAEFSNPELSIWNSKRGNLPVDRVLHNENGWKIFPPLGSFIEGGLLIVSEKHFRCCSALDKESALNLDAIILKTNSILKETYKTNILFFEHGSSACQSKGACCVDHAHINVFPINFNIWDYLPEFDSKYAIQSAVRLSEYINDEYLWIFDSQFNYIFPVNGVPSQFIRTIITKTMNIPARWNWQDYPGLEEIQKTISKLSGKWN